ncbi:MAG: Fe-S oxidoreductase [Arcobacter sp.]|uniref:(Fe-S)-binding protein n=1 Tax=uncultured Arcobacter sp. TaxID=165434 RepID=UPI000CC9C81F|nr:(Fe-S)-binding protein [uncultured Arcobacter sp.]PLY10811.1 MAG: Fe-S oxidoreductase [Arcobacter sp.]
MTIGLFIPCFMNELYPEASMATLKLLEKLNFNVEYPVEQTCCGQPMANSGCSQDIEKLAHRFVNTFKKYDYVVAPSGSCVTMVKEHYEPFFNDNKDYNKIKTSIYEITEFLHDIAKIDKLDSKFNFKVGVHNSCHGHRVLKLGSASELNITPYNKLENLLSLVEGIELVQLNRSDECCGFGGTFCVTEEAISVAMGKDRIKDHMDSNVEVMTGADMSCLMHMQGIINRDKTPIKVMHISEILLGETL